MKAYYLVTTGHLEEGVWFREDGDFVVGMNFVAVQVSRSKVVVVAFILMSNHVHFLLYGEYEDVLAFINQYKARYSMYYARKYGIKDFLRRNKVNVKEIPTEVEALKRAIAYIQMNPVAAGICLHPTQYPWGTGNVFFNPAKAGGRCLSEMSGRARKRTLHSECTDLPGEWLVSDEGYVLPESYVPVKSVERMFRAPSNMMYYLQTSSKAKKKLEQDESTPAFRDQAIIMLLPDLCQSLFRKGSFHALNLEEKVECMRQLIRRFSANINQVARVCGMSYAEAARLLDSV